jgi:hypothetical protein
MDPQESRDLVVTKCEGCHEGRRVGGSHQGLRMRPWRQRKWVEAETEG